MEYFDGMFFQSPNGDESLNKFLSLNPRPDHRRGGPTHGDNTSCVKKSSQSASKYLIRVGAKYIFSGLDKQKASLPPAIYGFFLTFENICFNIF